ncbi:MAG: hypothetical protein H7Y04_13930 [Verrucomicrobia bacterium]|nr:hypothetical protein [Cytophagales bacterium]
MTKDQKRAFLLLKSVIFHYHGLDESEQQILNETAEKLDAQEELAWVTDFIAQDPYMAFEKARAYLNSLAERWDTDTKLSYITMVWDATNLKGHITEMEALAMMKLAKDWGIQKDLAKLVQNRRNDRDNVA